MGEPTRIKVDSLDAPYRAADELLRKTVVKDGMISIPVDVEAIAKELGLDYQRLLLDEKTDGLLVKDEPNTPFKAVVDSLAHPHRARFTLSHEIGHYIHKYQDFPDEKIAGKVERRDEMSSRGIDPEEIWANRFAAALLMPAGIVAKLWADGKRIEDMADMFNVSLAAMGHRIENLGLR